MATSSSENSYVLHDACGVFGCIAAEGVDLNEFGTANNIFLGLLGIQHRGQESAGIVTSNGSKIYQHKGMGLVSNVFREQEIEMLPGYMGIGHNRYSTLGASMLINCQPFVVDTAQSWIAVAHNGELVNAKSLRKKILANNVGLSTNSDSELITQLLSVTPPCGEPEGANWPSRIKHLMTMTQCSYALAILTKDGIFGVRDPYGNRPLCVGRVLKATSEEGASSCAGWLLSSESCSFPSIGAEKLYDVEPGEIVLLTRKGVTRVETVQPLRPADPTAFCIFEYVYFARPDTTFEGQMVYNVRQECGRQLAVEAPLDAEIVSTVPESATPAAMGYAETTGIPYVEVLTRNRYVGRTFIQPSRRLRKLGVARKFGPLTANFQNKRIILIDDSIVRGNTMAPIIKVLREAGASEVHIRVASPPLKHPCYMGINIPTKEELIANTKTPDEIAKFFGADSLVYLSLDGLHSAVRKGIKATTKKPVGHCAACLTGEYPVDLEW